jgi:quercetin dioxygenase-like cupin family protein
MGVHVVFKSASTEAVERILMQIHHAGSRASGKGPAEYFSGTVRTDAVIDAPAPSRVRAVTVTFEPGARTAWHTHPVGQTLLILSGLGRVQRDGGALEEVRPGDVVWFAPGEKHWHGAAPDVAMSHLAIQEAVDGKAVDWLEQVSDSNYSGTL